jgi:hypothetical protein
LGFAKRGFFVEDRVAKLIVSVAPLHASWLTFGNATIIRAGLPFALLAGMARYLSRSFFLAFDFLALASL